MMSIHPEADRLIGKRVRIMDAHTTAELQWVNRLGTARNVASLQPLRVAVELEGSGMVWCDPAHLRVEESA